MPNCYYYDEQRNRCNCYVNDNLNELLSENAKLVDVLHEVETEAVYAYRCLQQDCVTTAESSEHFFKKWWHAECMNDNRLKRIDQLEAENARLRELVRDLYEMAYPEYPSAFDAAFADRMRELGVMCE